MRSIRHCNNDHSTTNGSIKSLDFTTTPSVPSTTSCTSHQQHHQTQRPTCPTVPKVPSSSSTASSWFHQDQQCGGGTTGGPATSSWSQQTTSFRCRQHHHGPAQQCNQGCKGSPSHILSFVTDASWQSSHIVGYNLMSDPKHVHIVSIISMSQRVNIRQRLRIWLQQHHPAVFHEFFFAVRRRLSQIDIRDIFSHRPRRARMTPGKGQGDCKFRKNTVCYSLVHGVGRGFRSARQLQRPERWTLIRASKWHYRQRKISFELIMHFIANTDTDRNIFELNFL